MNTRFGTPIQSKNDDLGTRTPSTIGVCLPRWETKTIEATRADARDINDSRKTRSLETTW
jgi:hypothetical protein